jgi:integrase
MAKAHLTDAFVKAAGPGRYADTHPKAPAGFRLIVYPSGEKSFALRYRNAQRIGRQIIIGSPKNGWTVEAAREEAKALRVKADKGIDLLEQKQERAEAPMMTDLVARYEHEVLPTLWKNSVPKRAEYRKTDVEKLLAEIVKVLGPNKPVAEVHQGDIAHLQKHFAPRGHSRANRILNLTSRMFSLALVPTAGETTPWRDQAQGNPCRGLKKLEEESSAGRLYSTEELARIFAALDAYPGPAADAVRLVALTGCRPTEILRARWSEFDGEPGKWCKPARTSKVKRKSVVPLNPAAAQIIERLRQRRRSDEVLFPGVNGEPIHNTWHVWDHVRRHADIGDGRLYDLRHSYASIGAGAGFSLALVGKLLGHSRAETTLRYAKHMRDGLQEVTDRIAEQIMPAAKPRPPAEIVKWRKR